jgi:hypothetical protein
MQPDFEPPMSCSKVAVSDRPHKPSGDEFSPLSSQQHKGEVMKSLIAAVALAFCLLAGVVGASAQQNLNFANLPLVNSPAPMPNGYGQLDWGNFFYVNPWGWSGAGPGYKLGPQGVDVAFIGGKYCRLSGNSCTGTLTDPLGFVAISARLYERSGIPRTTGSDAAREIRADARCGRA